MLLLFGHEKPYVPPRVPITEQSRVGTYTAMIAWGTGTTIDTSAYDDVSGWYLNQPGLVVDGIGRDQVRAYAPPAAPAWDLTLNNWDGRFSPGGPIGPLVGRGSDAWLDMTWGDDYPANSNNVLAMDQIVLANGIETLRLFDGVVESVQQTLTRPQRQTEVRALGHLANLLDKKPVILELVGGVWQPAVQQLRENVHTDVAVTDILNGVGWPQNKRVIDSGDTMLRYWWMDGQTTGWDMLSALLGAEGAGGCMYEDGNGVFHFEGRQTRQKPGRSTDTQWILTDGRSNDPNANSSLINANGSTTAGGTFDAGILANGQNNILLYDINPSEFTSNPDEVVTSVQAQVNQRAPVPIQVGDVTPEVGKVWEYGGPLVLTPSQPVITEALLSDPYRDAVLPVRYHTGDPTGSIAYDYAVTPDTAAVTVEVLAWSGIRVQLRWTAGVTPCTVNGYTSNGPQLRAVSLPVSSSITVRSTTDTTAFAPRYAGRQMQWAMWPEVSVGQTQAVVNSMCLRYMQERRQATVRLANIDGNHLWAMLHMRISDRVVWIQAHGGINDPYWIEQIHHEIAPGGGLHIVTLGLERVFDTVGERFDHPYQPGARGYDISRFGD